MITPTACQLPFELPPLTGLGVKPVWDGEHFLVDGERLRVVEYGRSEQGWNDQLTRFHEETAGDDHFIDLASRRHALDQVRRVVKVRQPVILEVGCSSGFMLKNLKDWNRNGITIGADIVKEPLEQLAKSLPGIPLLRFDLLHCPLADNSIDAVVLLNVLEHIEHDSIAVDQLFRILKPGGRAVLEVPAGPELYDNYDRMLLHFRRYELKGLIWLVRRCGFEIESASHLGFALYPGFWLVKRLSKIKSRSQSSVDTKAVEKNIKQSGRNHILKALIDLELKLGQWFSYPFGIRCLLTCKKPVI